MNQLKSRLVVHGYGSGLRLSVEGELNLHLFHLAFALSVSLARPRAPVNHHCNNSTQLLFWCAKMAAEVIVYLFREVIIGRAGASPPSRTAAIIFLYIYIFIYIFISVRPFWPPGGPALRANVAGQITRASTLYVFIHVYIYVCI